MITATWKNGFEGMFHGANPQAVAEEIMSLGENATTQQIVNKARDESTELHKCFEWDNDIAAEKYRMVQARYIVHHLVIKEKTVPKDRPEIRVFYKPSGSKSYVQTKHIIKDDDSYAKLLERAWAELRAFKAKYSCLKELNDIFELIN